MDRSLKVNLKILKLFKHLPSPSSSTRILKTSRSPPSETIMKLKNPTFSVRNRQKMNNHPPASFTDVIHGQLLRKKNILGLESRLQPLSLHPRIYWIGATIRKLSCKLGLGCTLGCFIFHQVSGVILSIWHIFFIIYCMTSGPKHRIFGPHLSWSHPF